MDKGDLGKAPSCARVSIARAHLQPLQGQGVRDVSSTWEAELKVTHEPRDSIAWDPKR